MAVLHEKMNYENMVLWGEFSCFYFLFTRRQTAEFFWQENYDSKMLICGSCLFLFIFVFSLHS